jgi:nitrite reductase/ring-hydroxylating ferredoxin subunit
MALHAVCKEDEIPIGSLKACKAGGENILVFHLEDGFYATQASCTHIFAPLTRGKLVDGCRIQCPFHRAQFDVRTGEVVKWANFPPGVQLETASGVRRKHHVDSERCELLYNRDYRDRLPVHPRTEEQTWRFMRCARKTRFPSVR